MTMDINNYCDVCINLTIDYSIQVERMNYCAPGGFLCRWIDKEGNCVRNSNGSSGGEGSDEDEDVEEKDKLLSRLIANK